MLDPQLFQFTYLIYHPPISLPYIQISLNELTTQYFWHLQTEKKNNIISVLLQSVAVKLPIAFLQIL